MTGKIKKFWEKIYIIAAGILSALALNVSFAEASDAVEPDTSSRILLKLFKCIVQMQDDLKGKGVYLTILAAGLTVTYMWLRRKLEGRKVPCVRWMSALFAVLYTGGVAFEQADSLRLLISPAFNIIRTLILITGTYCMYFAAICALYILISDSRGYVCGCKHAFLYTWLGICVCWIPGIILRYPGVMGVDSWTELAFYFGRWPFDTSQPVFHTWLLGTFVNLGKTLGSANAGLFLFVLLQFITGSLVLAWTLKIMRQLKTPRWLQITAFIVYAFVPAYTGYVSFPIKDVIFSYMFVWGLGLMIQWIYSPEDFWKKGTYIAGWMASGTLLILVRKNGIYIYAAELAVILFWHIRKIIKDKKAKTGTIVMILAGLLLPICISASVKTVITNTYQVQKDSAKEAFSLPLQQTARFVREHGDSISQKDLETIDRMVNAEKLAESYDETTADPVKALYHASDVSDILAYAGVWAKEFWQCPACYIEATWNQFYALFMPDRDISVYNLNVFIGVNVIDGGDILEEVPVYVPDGLDGWNDICARMYDIIDGLPLIGLLCSVGFYVLLTFTLGIWLICRHKKRRDLMVLVPLAVSFAFVLLGPAILGNPRYAFPIVYSAPLFMAFCIKEEKNDNEKI